MRGDFAVGASGLRRVGASRLRRVGANRLRRVGANRPRRVGASTLRRVGASRLRWVGANRLRGRDSSDRPGTALHQPASERSPRLVLVRITSRALKPRGLYMRHPRKTCLRAFTIAIIAVLAGIGCGSSTSPTYPILQGPGPYWLDVIGFAISTNPDVPPCLAPVTVLTAVRVRLDVTIEGTLWVARSPSPFGDLELRIRGDGEVAGGIEVRGSVRGTASDSETRPVSGVSVRIGGANAASVEGLAERTGRFV